MLYTYTVKKGKLSSIADMVDEPLKGTGLFLARKIQTAERRISFAGIENGGGACGRE